MADGVTTSGGVVTGSVEAGATMSGQARGIEEVIGLAEAGATMSGRARGMVEAGAMMSG